MTFEQQVVPNVGVFGRAGFAGGNELLAAQRSA